MGGFLWRAKRYTDPAFCITFSRSFVITHELQGDIVSDFVWVGRIFRVLGKKKGLLTAEAKEKGDPILRAGAEGGKRKEQRKWKSGDKSERGANREAKGRVKRAANGRERRDGEGRGRRDGKGRGTRTGEGRAARKGERRGRERKGNRDEKGKGKGDDKGKGRGRERERGGRRERGRRMALH